MSTKDRVKVYEGKDGLWYWRRLAANGERIAQGEGYSTRSNAIRGARRANPTAYGIETPSGFLVIRTTIGAKL